MRRVLGAGHAQRVSDVVGRTDPYDLRMREGDPGHHMWTDFTRSLDSIGFDRRTWRTIWANGHRDQYVLLLASRKDIAVTLFEKAGRRPDEQLSML